MIGMWLQRATSLIGDAAGRRPFGQFMGINGERWGTSIRSVDLGSNKTMENFGEMENLIK